MDEEQVPVVLLVAITSPALERMVRAISKLLPTVFRELMKGVADTRTSPLPTSIANTS
jgi:hypothetical protein